MDEDYFRSIRHWLRAESAFSPDALRDAAAEAECPPVIPAPRAPSE
jgi:hypothetical protein